MSINIRAKGQEGEREIQKYLEPIIRKALQDAGYTLGADSVVQRNQNQSAVGGSDLSNTFGLAIEVKRQEQLSVGTWWKQCEAAAVRNGETPVLVYRQNRKAWRCVMYADLPLPATASVSSNFRALVELSFDQFLTWFDLHVRRQITLGAFMPRI